MTKTNAEPQMNDLELAEEIERQQTSFFSRGPKKITRPPGTVTETVELSRSEWQQSIAALRRGPDEEMRIDTQSYGVQDPTIEQLAKQLRERPSSGEMAKVMDAVRHLGATHTNDEILALLSAAEASKEIK